MRLTKQITVFLTSVFLATVAVVGAVALDPTAAEAAGGGYVNRCGGGKVFLKQEEKRSFGLHNRIRRDHGLRPFCLHPALQKAARAHSKDMVRRDYLAHGNVGARLERAGYDWRIYGENIAWGSGPKGSPDTIMSAWMRSKTHRHNILNGKFHEIGIGTYTGTFQGHDNATMYTADFGTRRR